MDRRVSLKSLIVCGVAVGLSGCTSRPSDSAAKSVFVGRLQRDVGDVSYTIDTFTKTNGQQVNIMGVTAYAYFYQAKVTFPQGLHSECVYHGTPSPSSCAWIPRGGTNPNEPGTSVTYSGEADFQKTENGWVPAS